MCEPAALQIAKLLIDAKADLAACDSKKNTPLHYAAGYGRSKTAELLLAAGADKTAQNETGKTAFQLVTMEPRNPLNQEAQLLQKLQ